MSEARAAFRSRIYRIFCIFILFYAAASASYLGFYTLWHFHEAGAAGHWDLPYGIDDVLNGTAYRPVIYRQMIPATANWLDKEIPQGIKDRVIRQRFSHDPNPNSSPLRYNKAYLIRYEIVYDVSFLFAFLAVIAMYLVCKSFGFSPMVCIFTPVVFILIFPYFLNWGGYYYDYPELAFFALSIWIAREYKWWWLLPVALLATWNKETYLIFIPMLYPFVRAKLSRLQAFAGIGCLCAASFAVYYRIHTMFQGNLTGPAVSRWREHLDMLVHFYQLFIRIDTIYNIYTLSSFSFFPLAMITWTVCRGWHRFTPEFKLHAKIAALINFPLFFFFCSLYEMRNLSMLYMVFLLGLAVNLQETFAGKKAAAGVDSCCI
jgi:hypothetical protein